MEPSTRVRTFETPRMSRKGFFMGKAKLSHSSLSFCTLEISHFEPNNGGFEDDLHVQLGDV